MSIKIKGDYLEKKDNVELLFGIETSADLIEKYKNMELNENDLRILKKNKRKDRLEKRKKFKK